MGTAIGKNPSARGQQPDELARPARRRRPRHRQEAEVTPDSARESTTVVVVGAGVAGLTAASLLRRCGIGCVVLERQRRAHVEQRQRAGVVEYRGARMFEDWGLGSLLDGFPTESALEIRRQGEPLMLLRDELSRKYPGRLIPQQVLVARLIAAFADTGGDLRFGAADVSLRCLDTDRPMVSYTDTAGQRHEIACSFVAGCDGGQGICRTHVPDGALTAYTHDYGIVWLTVLASSPPPPHPMMAASTRGFAGHFARGPQASRFYLQCAPGEEEGDWPDSRIWLELRARLGDEGLPSGPVTEREIFHLRSCVYEPMSYGRLYLLGDAAHVIAPVGGKGMNLALHDAEVFARAVRDFARSGDERGLRAYSSECLHRVWEYQDFARWLTETTHGPADSTNPFLARLAAARLDRLMNSEAAGRVLAEFMAGLA